MLSSKFKSMRRKGRVRARLKKDQSERIRLTVYRSNNHVSAQLIDDTAHKTLASVSTLENVVRSEIKFGGNMLAASLVGKLIAQRGIALGIEQIVFDRGEYLYHGRVKALADAARLAGLKF